jgi:glycine dehydrogenase
MALSLSDLLQQVDQFAPRHLGPRSDDITSMLDVVGVDSLDALVALTIPSAIRMDGKLDLPPAMGEREIMARLRELADRNEIFRSLIGMGYSDCVTPPVIQRNILENPGWYTQYTPYQAEIAQGRLEALINFQTVVSDLTGLPMANSSLLDEATAAAEAMAICYAAGRKKKKTLYIADTCHPQTIEVVQTRAEPLGLTLHIGPLDDVDFAANDYCGIILQYPDTHGRLIDPSETIAAAKAAGALAVVASDLLALTVVTPPGEFGADIVIGNSQRFGVSLGLGGPHAAFLSTHDKYRRLMPGRIVGVSKDVHGALAYRLALQTREQHIRRESATSNICTAQVLLAIMASMYAVYHGPVGLRRIGERVHGLTGVLAAGLRGLGYDLGDAAFFDTLYIQTEDAAALHQRANAARINLRPYAGDAVGIALDELTSLDEVQTLLDIFAGDGEPPQAAELLDGDYRLPGALARTSTYLQHPVFSNYHAEHEMLRYLNRLQAKDLSLTTSMIPLGSCTMKLNATTEMLAVTWPEFASIHPFAPKEQWAGYSELFEELEAWLSEITGFAGVSLQPNAGSQGEYAGLLVIRGYHRDRGDAHRNICLIPTSAHGTNPASAVMAGMKVVPVRCNDRGDIDVADLRARAEEHADNLAALMITYPSTHGVFEASVMEICEIIHTNGGQVYMDGANMNAQVGLCRPGDIGADVCHLNLHKTFCIPHGGGGPGMGPIGVAAHLLPYLPGHSVTGLGDEHAIGAISAAPYGSPSILPISYAYIAMMGEPGLTRATKYAILGANYMATRVGEHYDVVYTGDNGRVAHEFIIDCRGFKAAAGVSVDDIAKRLMDYGFHAPTMSFPVVGTLMIEPTESEAKAELDRLCDALIAIRKEIRDIEEGKVDAEDNALHNAPHTARRVGSSEWPHSYSREAAAWPAAWLSVHKYWPPVSRIDNAFGDRNPICTCPSMAEYE